MLLIWFKVDLNCKLHFMISSPSQEFCNKSEISVCFALAETNTFSLDKSTGVIEDDAMAVEIKMEDTKPNHSGLESPPSSSVVAIDDNEKCYAVIATLMLTLPNLWCIIIVQWDWKKLFAPHLKSD